MSWLLQQLDLASQTCFLQCKLLLLIRGSSMPIYPFEKDRCGKGGVQDSLPGQSEKGLPSNTTTVIRCCAVLGTGQGSRWHRDCSPTCPWDPPRQKVLFHKHPRSVSSVAVCGRPHKGSCQQRCVRRAQRWPPDMFLPHPVDSFLLAGRSIPASQGLVSSVCPLLFPMLRQAGTTEAGKELRISFLLRLSVKVHLVFR